MKHNKGGGFRKVSYAKFSGQKNFHSFLGILEVTLELTAIYESDSEEGNSYQGLVTKFTQIYKFFIPNFEMRFLEA